jgi:hypothetical protein
MKKSKSDKKRKKEEEVLLTECAIYWHEQLLSPELLKDIKFKGQFDRYFELSSRLMDHSRAKKVTVGYSNGGKKTYYVAQKILVNGSLLKTVKKVYPGIHDRLQSVFYPEVSENPIEKSKRNKELGGRKPLNKNLKSGMKTPCSKSGSNHGTMVHNQIDRLTRVMNRQGNFDYYLKQKEEVDHCVISFVDLCIKKGWFPLASEFIIYDEDIDVATAIDLLVVDILRWKLIMIEIKTGYEDEEYGLHPNDTKFSRVITDLTNCPLNRHLLQLVTMDMMLRVKYDVIVDELYIIRMCPRLGIIEEYAPSEWCNQEKYRLLVYTSMIK